MNTPYEWVFGGQCAVCKKPFDSMHLASQTTCGSTCRKRLQRIRQSEKKALSRAMSELQLVRGGIKRKERLPEFISELYRLKEEVTDLLLLAGDEEQMAKREMIMGRKKHLRHGEGHSSPADRCVTQLRHTTICF